MVSYRINLQRYKLTHERSVTIEDAKKMTDEELQEKIVVGEFVSRRLPTLTERINKIQEEAGMYHDTN